MAGSFAASISRNVDSIARRFATIFLRLAAVRSPSARGEIGLVGGARAGVVTQLA